MLFAYALACGDVAEPEPARILPHPEAILAAWPARVPDTSRCLAGEPVRFHQRTHVLAVLDVLRRHQNSATGLAWPSVATIARSKGLTERAVWRILKSLRGAGLLEVVAAGGGRGRMTRYRIVWTKLVDQIPGPQVTESHSVIEPKHCIQVAKPCPQVRRTHKTVQKTTKRAAKLPPHPDTKRLVNEYRQLVRESGTAPTPETYTADMGAARQVLESVKADEALGIIKAILGGVRGDRDGWHRRQLLAGLRHLSRRLPELSELARDSRALPPGLDHERLVHLRALDNAPAADVEGA